MMVPTCLKDDAESHHTTVINFVNIFMKQQLIESDSAVSSCLFVTSYAVKQSDR